MVSKLLGVAVISLVLAGVSWAAEPQFPLPGPRLEDLPGPAVDSANLPPPAQWPVLRYERPLRILAIQGRGGYESAMQRIARRMHAKLEVRFLSLSDIYGADIHILDYWEQNKNPTSDELRAYNLGVVSEALEPKDGARQFDAVFVLDPAVMKEAGLQEKLLACMTAGKTVAVCFSYYPAADQPLAKVWPASPAPNNACLWMSEGAQRTDCPELSGLPLGRLAGHTWIPIPKVAEGAVALSDGQSGSVYKRTVGKGTLLFVPTGPISRVWNAMEKHGRQFDHDEVWLRLWDQMLYEIAHNDAFPAYTDLRAGAAEAPPGQDYVLPAKVIGRSWKGGPLAVSVHVTNPRGTVVYRRDETVTVGQDATKAVEVRVPVAPDWPKGLYPVYLTLGDPAAKKQIHQSMEWIPVAGSLDLALTSAKRGYKLGEEAAFTATLAGKGQWSGTVRFAVYDYRGRLLAADEKPAQVGGQKQDLAFSYRLADHGVKVDTLWAQAAAVREGKEFARAEVQFYRYEPWSMRKEYQWSAWTNLGGAAPSVIPSHMRLMAHAGMNALGFSPGEEWYLAERWGWRYYNEGLGINTFSPVIEYENEAEIEQWVAKELKPNDHNLYSAAFVLGSVGEEAGYKDGWGKKYYWDTPVAPDKACKALQWFLKSKYTTLERLNAVWKTAYATWDDVKLTKEFSGAPPAPLMAGGSPNPENAGKDAPKPAASVAPYTDTELFYAWYYDKIVAVAKRLYREKINPVTLAFSSAPASWIFDSRENDLRNVSPSVWNELQTYSTWAAPEPSFGLTGMFEFRKVQDNQLNGFLFCNTTHQTCWVDVPVHFNNDTSHTRASFALRKWTHRLAGHEGILLDAVPRKSPVGVLAVNGIPGDTALTNLNTSLAVTLAQSGYGYTPATDANLGDFKILFAPGYRAVSAAMAKKLDQFVNDGGMLVMFPRFGSQSEYGEPAPAAPTEGLAEKWGIALKPGAVPPPAKPEMMTFDLRGVRQDFGPWRLTSSQGYMRDEITQTGWQQLAAYGDTVPALLSRQYGRGRLVYVNANYQSHRYIQWITPTDPARQGFCRLVEWLCGESGIRRDFRIDGNLAETLHLAARESTDSTGSIHYLLLGTETEVPWVGGTLNWFDGEETGYDILGGEPGQPTPRVGRSVPLSFQPGTVRLMAFVAKPVAAIRVECTPDKINAGEPVKIAVRILDDKGQAIPGRFPLVLSAINISGREIAGLRRAFSAESGGAITLNTALTDPAGPWMITVTDGVSGQSGTFKLKVGAAPQTAPRTATKAPSFVPWGWPSELVEPPAMTEIEFLQRLESLHFTYSMDQSGKGWLTKMHLGYYNEYFPNTRHALITQFNDLDWMRYADAITRDVTGHGGVFVLTGEDVGIDPQTGLATWPHNDGKQLPALAKALSGATWYPATADGDTLVAELGRGRVVLCRESIDAAGNTHVEQGRWQTRWLAEVAKPGGLQPVGRRPSIRTPSADDLAQWWIGRRSLVKEPRHVTWLGDNSREIAIACDPAKDQLDQVFTLALPPTGAVTAASLKAELAQDGTLKIDVGCDGTPDGEIVRGGTAKTPIDWPAALTRYLHWRDKEFGGPIRNGSNWRIVPCRVTSGAKLDVKIGQVDLEVR